MASIPKSPTALEQLVEEVTFYRNKGLRRASKAEGTCHIVIARALTDQRFEYVTKQLRDEGWHGG
jgi:hypothetical protein